MDLEELIEFLINSREHFEKGEKVEVAFLPPKGDPTFVCFNICTVYTEDKLVVLSIEGEVIEIFQK